MNDNCLISLVVPMYNERDGCQLFFDRVLPILSGVTANFEIVCVDDGSTDSTFETLCALRHSERRIKIIRLARNFGKEVALSAGLDYASGAAVIPIDADLQDPPELIPEMIRLWRNGDYKSVIAIREARSGDSFLKRTTANAFYQVASRLSEVVIHPNAGDFRLLDRSVVDALRLLPERSRFMKGLYSWVGFRSTSVRYSRPARAVGESKWSLWKLWNFALDGIFSFTTMPLRIWTYVGILIAGLSAAYGSIIVFRTLIHGIDVPGYASLLVTMLFLGGVNLIGLGILGEYIGRIFMESKQRPLYFVQSVVSSEEPLSGKSPASAEARPT